MDTVIVTGAAGFIGFRTTLLLLESGIKVIGIDNLNDYYDVKLKLYRLNLLKDNSNFIFYHNDIEDFLSLDKLFSENKADAIINLAARAGVRYSLENPFVYLSTNILGTLNLLELMKKYDIKKLVLASSSSVYANEAMPFVETLPVNTPISTYASSKKSAESLCFTYRHLYNIDISILRYFTVFGPAGRPDMSYFRFIKQIDEGKSIDVYGDGTQARDFTFIDDIASGTVKALKNLGCEIINLGGGNNPITLNYMINKIEEYLGKSAKINFKSFEKTDMKVTWADIQKAKELLNWKPLTEFDEGLQKTVEWYNNNKGWLKDIRI